MLSLQVKILCFILFYLINKKIAWLKLKVLSHNLFILCREFSGFLFPLCVGQGEEGKNQQSIISLDEIPREIP
jgi:hypothetical protein